MGRAGLSRAQPRFGACSRSAVHTSSFSRVWVTPGLPRNVTLGMQAKF